MIFIDGEFWHGYDWNIRKHHIKTNQAFWIPKIERNIQKDLINNETLFKMGFTVMRFGEQQVKRDLDKCLNQILIYTNNHISH